MTSKYDEDRQQAANKHQAEDNMNRLRLWLEHNHQVYTTVASQKQFLEYFGDRICTPLSEDDFAFAFDKKNSGNLPMPTEEEQKAELIEEICSLLKSKDGGRDGKHSNFDIQTVRTKMSANQWTVQKLTERRDEILREQALNRVSVPELHQIVRDAEPKRRYPGYPNLPDTIVPSGQVQAVKCDAAYLYGLAKNDFYLYKRMVEKFGSQQINDRQKGV